VLIDSCELRKYISSMIRSVQSGMCLLENVVDVLRVSRELLWLRRGDSLGTELTLCEGF
jgi:hypothetical protein